MADDTTNSDLIHTKQNHQVHNDINITTKLEEELQWWQEKVLELKLKKVKDDLEYNKNKTIIDKEIQEEKQINIILKSNLDEINEKKKKFKEESSSQINKLNKIRENIKHFETANTDMYNEFIQKTNFIKQLENPDNLLMHLLQFDRETLRTLCINLNNLQKEKFMHFMMQQQYYNQMYFSQQNKGIYPSPYGMYNYKMSGNGTDYANHFEGGEEDAGENGN
jgi:hypothetical protein